MTYLDLLKIPSPDIEKLKTGGDVPALINLMGHADPEIRCQAVDALKCFGDPAALPLISALNSPKGLVRLGATEALAAIKYTGAPGALANLFHHEKNIEIRWACILALGELGSPDSIPSLIVLLRDENKYLRYGAACSLDKLGWHPSSKTEEIYYFIARHDWDAVRKTGNSAILPLSIIFRETDVSTRSNIISLLGEMGDSEAHKTCQAGLKDRNSAVRWTAVLASMNCGIKSIHLPPLVADRERSGPNPAAAALLNFLFLGIGYNYIGKWWGFPVFMTYMSLLVLAQLYFGPFLPYLVAYPVTAVLGLHTYYITERMPDL
jgi:HEAT repeat protein